MKRQPIGPGDGSLDKVPAFEARGTEFCHTETVYGTTINEKGVYECEGEQGRTDGGNIWTESREGGYEVIYYDFKE